jgi:hypothetical protein
MSLTVPSVVLLSSDELLEEDLNTAALAQISQEPLQGAAYRLRTSDLGHLPASEELLDEDLNTATLAQISQEPLQGAAYRLRTR